MLLRFVEQRPVSEMTCQFLEWVVEQVRAMGGQPGDVFDLG
jgi:hypothetical protein